jgi:hypothetical protein
MPARAGTVPVTPATDKPQSAPAATEPGSAIVRRRRSQPLDPSPDPGNKPHARHPATTGTATVAPLGTKTRPAESPPPGPLRLSPTDSSLGRPIIRRRKHPSPEPSTRTPIAVTTEKGPPLRAGPRPESEARIIGRTAMSLPLPVAGERPPSTRGSAPASPVAEPGPVSLDRPSGAADVPPPGPVRREKSSTIETSDAAAFRGDLGTAIQSRYANTTIARSTGPLPVSMALPRQSRPSRVDRSVENVPAVAGNRPGMSTMTASGTITVPSPTVAYPIPGPHAATVRSHGEQPIREQGQDHRSRSADRLPTAASPTQPTVFRTLADTARPHPATPVAHSTVFRAPMDTARPRPTAPGARIGSTDALSLPRSPLPLAVQRQAHRFSTEPAPRGASPATAWRTGEPGRSPFAIGAARTPTGQGSGSVTAVPIEDSAVGAEVEPNPPAAGDGERPNVDDLVDKVLRKLMRRLTIEQERRGRQRWF